MYPTGLSMPGLSDPNSLTGGGGGGFYSNPVGGTYSNGGGINPAPTVVPSSSAPSPTSVSNVLGLSTAQPQSRPAPTPAPAPSGGGSNSNQFPSQLYPGWDSASAQADWNAKLASGQAQSMLDAFNANTPGTSQYMNNVSSLYNDVLNSFDQTKSDLGAALQSGQGTITQQYQSLLPALQSAEQTQLNTIQGQRQNESANQQNALAQANQLFNELRQSVGSRYGGNNSVADFANNFYNNQAVGNLNSINSTYGQNLRGLDTATQNAQQAYQGQVNTINSQMSSALSQLQSQYQDQLAQIDQNKSMAQEDKAQAQLGALQTLQQQAYGIQQGARQALTNLVLQAQQGANSIGGSIAYGQALKGEPINLNAYNALQYNLPNTTQPGQRLLNNIYGAYQPNPNNNQQNQFGF